MTTLTIKQKLVDYINRADAKKVKAIYTLVENEIDDIWQNKEFIAELDRRVADMKSGKDKGYSWEEAQENIRLRRLNKKKTA
jgi:putative addiction module component (TIGR02574 family)